MVDVEFIILVFLVNIFYLIKNQYISELFKLYDHPDFKRKIHLKKIPCIGGYYIFSNIILLIFYDFFNSSKLIPYEYFQYETTNFFFFIITFIVIFLIGIYDDKYGLKPNIKLILFILVILFLVKADRDLAIKSLRFSFIESEYDISDYSQFFTIFCIIVFMNAFNMYDGSNLQVSSISIVIMLYFFSLTRTFDYLSFTVIVSLGFFSILNFKNKLFLGDNGSLILSFLISYSIIKFYNMNNFIYADEVCLILLLPIIDLLRLFIYRISSGKSPFLSDKKHLHHLILKKISYNKSILLLFMLYLLPIALAFITKKYLISIVVQVIIYSILVIFFKENHRDVR